MVLLVICLKGKVIERKGRGEGQRGRERRMEEAGVWGELAGE